jgi:cobalt-zinc-cadmium efflux system outer membrane protein
MLAGMPGCVATRAGAGFQQVRQAVADRTGKTVFWNTNSSEDEQAALAVDRLLRNPLTPESAVQVALLNNAGLQATFEEIGIAQADLVRAGLLKNPVFSGAYEFASGGGLSKINLSVTEDFLDVLQVPMRKRAASADLIAARSQAASAVLGLARDVRRTFYDYQAARQIASLKQVANEASQAALQVSDRLHQAGNLTDFDLATAQASAGQSELDAASASSDVNDLREELNELMGISSDAARDWSATDSLPEVPSQIAPPQGLESLALRDRLDLAEAQLRFNAASYQLAMAKQFAFLGDAAAGASAEREHDGTWETGPSVSVPIPFFDFGGASVAACEARGRQAHRRLEALQVHVLTEVRKSISRMQSAADEARCFREKVLPAREKVLAQTLLRYDGMLASVFQLLAAKQSHLDAQIGLTRATRDYWIARAELEYAVGGKLN